jgi:ribosomal protein L20A (L18A)
MNKKMYVVLVISLIFGVGNCTGKSSFYKKMKAFFCGNVLEKVYQEEFCAASLDMLSLNAINGSIVIKSGPKKSLFLKTIQRAKKEDNLNAMQVIVDTHVNNHLSITTKDNSKKMRGSIDYELIVPTSLDLALTISGKGNVYIKDVHGIIQVVAQDAIVITNTKELVSAQTLKKGSITVINAVGPVEAYSQQGTIRGENIANSFDAHSIKGKINVVYKKLPTTSLIKLKTVSGNITLALPADTNAEICGYTTQGTLLSEHDITLKPYTTKLNKSAWNKFTKEVNGVLGTGEATIMLHSTKGNVKIIQTKTT